MPRLLITGANRGIGLEFVRSYLADGWEVIATCRNPAGASDLNALSAEVGQRLIILPLDVTDPAAVKAMGDNFAQTPIDLLINNAGLYQKGAQSIGSYDAEAWVREFRTNTIGPALVCQALIGSIAKADGKTIVTISSQMGSIDDASTGSAYYRSSKTAVNMIMHTLANQFRQDGIKIIPVHPGWVQTDMGGPNALIDVKTSVAGLRRVIDNLTLEQSGTFFSYDGRPLPW